MPNLFQHLFFLSRHAELVSASLNFGTFEIPAFAIIAKAGMMKMIY